ncbi:MAG: helix-turn-helix transcriptional regulator [Cyanobacteria bacterium P01_D01_bin.44]
MSNKPRSTTPNHHKHIDRINSERLTELAEFLKSCRKRTNPETFGLPSQPRRRNPGLSRAEVASLAGISVDWYTWLEQGRDIRPSVQVLDNLTKVFRLTEPEKRYLYALTDYPPIPTEALDADVQLMRCMIGHMPKAPAIVLRKDWQILTQNACADELFGTWSHVEETNKNILYLFFTAPIFTEHLRHWEWHAKIAIRQFRAIYATEIGNPVFVSLIERLNNISPHFSQWWAETDVAGRDDGRKEFDHPSLGYLDYDYTILRPAENQALEVIIFIPRAA